MLEELDRDDPRSGDIAEISRAAKQASALSHALLVLSRGERRAAGTDPKTLRLA